MELPAALSHWLRDLYATEHHRQLIVVSGECDWCHDIAQAVIDEVEATDTLWFGDGRNHTSALPVEQFRRYLGRETAVLVYDAFSGVRANALMALSGTVSRGGIMLLLCPPLACWPEREDPGENQRRSYGFNRSVQGSHLIRWLCNCIASDPAVTFVSKHTLTLGMTASPQSTDPDDSICATTDQLRAVKLLSSDAMKNRKAPLVLTADRGRGKSSALGIAAARLMRDTPVFIAVTASRPSATEQVFAHAKKALQIAENTAYSLEYNDANLAFVAPDALLCLQPLPDVIMVDEAAALPHAILADIAALGSPCIFSTTLHGYEGSGRGFELRFKSHLEQHYPGYVSHHMTTPVRWYPEDPLEQFWFRSMMMSPPYSIHEVKPEVHGLKDGFHVLASATLVARPNLLYQIFRLLVDAHYQTTQDDLTRMLDATDNTVAVWVMAEEVIAVALLATEGTERLHGLSEAISEGKRRVQGHLSAQYLAYHFAQSDWATRHFLRVVRIAVKPDAQRQGHGQKMLEHIAEYALEQDADFLTTSFGATPALIRFWLNAGFSCLKLGNKRDASSGETSLLMARALKPTHNELVSYCQARLSLQLGYFHKASQPMLSAPVLGLLAEEQKPFDTLSVADNRIIYQCAQGIRPIDNAIPLVAWHLRSAYSLDELTREHALLFDYFLQQKDIKTLVKQYRLTGKRALFKALALQLQSVLPHSAT